MGWDKCHLWDLSSEGSGRTRFTKLVHIRIWNTKITVKIYLRSNISPSYRFRSHRNICLLVTVISLDKMLPRHKTMFAVVSAGVWGNNSLKNWCRYRVQLVLPSFFLYSSFRAWLTLRDRFLLASVCRKNAENCACSPGHRFFSLLSSVTRASRSLHACLRLTEKRWKVAPVLQIQASSMKLRVHGFLFLVFLHIKTDGKDKLILITTSTFR